MRKFGLTNPHLTAFALKQWLYKKETTAMESKKMYCPSRCRKSSYLGGGRKVPRFMCGSIRTGMEICGTSGVPIPMVLRLH